MNTNRNVSGRRDRSLLARPGCPSWTRESYDAWQSEIQSSNRKAQLPLTHGPANHYHTVVDQLGTTFAALSDPTRRAMIERLAHGPASVHELTEQFPLSQQMISKHIAYLVRARILSKRKCGRESVCTLRPEAIKTVGDWAFSYRRFWEESLDKLDEVVSAMKKGR